MDNERPEFVTADFIIFGITVAISIGIGICHAVTGGKQKTTAEYLVGNGKMSIIPVALSLVVSFESSILMLGYPAEVYVYGIMILWYSLGSAVSSFIGGHIVVPLIHPLKIKSVFEYFELRYKGRTIRLLGTTAGIVYYVLYMGIVLFGPGIALEATTNMPFWISVVIVATASVVYTSIGGIKAVIWTDVFQCLLMFMGVFAVLIRGTMLAGGPSKVFQINANNGRLNLFNFDPDPTVRHTVWSLVFGVALRSIHVSFNQSTVQRISSMETQRHARRVIYVSAIGFFLTLAFVTLEGVVVYAYYGAIRCDPLTSNQISNSNQILPFMVLDIFRDLPGMAGVFMASLFSASLSTMSSGLSSLCAMTVEDYIKPHFKTLSDTQLTIIAKITVPIYGLLGVGVSFMIANIPGPLSQISGVILSAISGPTCGLFLYSVFFPWATTKGAMVGTISSMILSSWLSLGKTFSTSLRKTPWATMPSIDQCSVCQNATLMNFTVPLECLSNGTTETITDFEPQGLDKYYALSYLWIASLGMLYCIVISIATSIFEGLKKSEDIDVRYVLPFFDQFFPFLPLKLRKKLYFGVKFEQREEWLKSLTEGKTDYTKKRSQPTENDHTTSLVVDCDKGNDTKYYDEDVKTLT